LTEDQQWLFAKLRLLPYQFEPFRRLWHI
jgi:hypothetical protein